MKGHILVPLNGGVSICNLEHGPDGEGTYEISVSVKKLSSDEILHRLRQRLEAPVAPAEPRTEDEGTRVVGCVEMGPHQEHQIWVENPEWHNLDTWGWAQQNPKVKPHYIWQTCPGMT